MIPVSNEHHLEYVKKLNDLLFRKRLEVKLTIGKKKLGYKIREAQTKKIPYQIVCGDHEVTDNLITYRKYGSSQTTTVTMAEFVAMIKQEIKTMGR